MKKAEEMNADPNDQATYGVTEFADWTNEEFMKLNGLLPADDLIIYDNEEDTGLTAP